MYFESQQDLLAAAARCQYVVCGSGTVSKFFWYQKKPVIFIRGRVGQNPFKGLGWTRIKRDTDYPLFSEVLDASPKITHWKQFNAKFLEKAKWCPAAQKIFYPSNFDKALTQQKIRDAVAELTTA